MNINEKIGVAIKELRENKGYSQNDFAKKCNIDKEHYSEIELGKYNIKLFTLEKICEVLDTTPRNLLSKCL